VNAAVARVHFLLDDELHAQAKARAALERVPLKDWIADAIAEKIDRDEAEETKRGKGKR
jgi:predicted HicB family RNase H-like nuclease